ncbi:hypothetical protein [Streptomyces sp. NPDC050988]|uniref:hypothetical protein n=1 Tax=Streptomyces sp. NPDC050988 TaxID=3365637 RepID=UPI0037BDE096
MTGKRTAALIAELLVRWFSLSALWLVLISTVDALEVLAGAARALLVAVLAVAARRAVTDR